MRLTDGNATQPVSANWTANEALFIPFSIPWPYLVNRVFWMSGSTITTSNADFGIYTSTGKRIWNLGSTALSGASAIEYSTVASPFLLSPGTYYMAYACDNTTNRFSGIAGITAAGLLSCTGLNELGVRVSVAGFTRPYRLHRSRGNHSIHGHHAHHCGVLMARPSTRHYVEYLGAPTTVFGAASLTLNVNIDTAGNGRRSGRSASRSSSGLRWPEQRLSSGGSASLRRSRSPRREPLRRSVPQASRSS